MQKFRKEQIILESNNKKRQTIKSVFLIIGAKDAKLELLCKIFIDKLTSESILYIDFALSEYQKIKNVA